MRSVTEATSRKSSLVASAAVCLLFISGSQGAVQQAPAVCPSGLPQNAFFSGEDLGYGYGHGHGHEQSQSQCASLGGCMYEGRCRRSPVPSLDDLAGQPQFVAEVYNHPSVEGFYGGIKTTTNLLSFEGGTFPPLSQGGTSAVLRMEGSSDVINATWARWFPYQVVRDTQMDSMNLTTTARMGFEQNLILMQLEVQNVGGSAISPHLQIDLNSFWAYEPGTWPWETPRPSDFANFTSSFPSSSTFLTVDTQSSTSSAFAFSWTAEHVGSMNGTSSAIFAPSIASGQCETLQFVVAVGNSSASATIASAGAALMNFSHLWDEALLGWSQMYQTALEPSNTFFSGSYPVLVTEDHDMALLWYQSLISILATMRTNLLYPRVYATVGPLYGTTIVYAWDTSLWSSTLTLLDPAFLREQVSLFLLHGVYNGYAVDYLSDDLVGPWYSANDMAIFSTMLNYVNMTGDVGWLQEPAVNGSQPAANVSTNLDQMEARATHWMVLENPEFGLGDYGGLSNLLEEVTTYTNMVPSLNAANVWMMNQFANILAFTGNASGAAIYHAKADALASTVLNAYGGGDSGVWYTTYPDGNRQIVKHIYDFDMISLYFTQYLNESIKSAMMSFAERELYTGYWMRALSVSDLAANVSMRPDHGSNGAYTSWPALAAAGISQLGDYDTMISYLRTFAGVLSESTWAQCYQLIDPLGPAAASAAEAAALWASSIPDFSGTYFGGVNGTAPAGLEGRARISLPDQGEVFNENNGASMADVILRYVFGWRPNGRDVEILDANIPRGNFTGSLLGVKFGDKFYHVKVGNSGVSVAGVECDYW